MMFVVVVVVVVVNVETGFVLVRNTVDIIIFLKKVRAVECPCHFEILLDGS